MLGNVNTSSALSAFEKMEEKGEINGQLKYAVYIEYYLTM